MKVLPIDKFHCQDFPIIDYYNTIEVEKEINGKTFTVKEQQPVYKQGIIEITQEQLNGLIAQTHCFNDTLTAVIPYVPTQEEQTEKKAKEATLEITKLKKQLSDMDYKTSKYADGDYTEEEWALIKEERKAIRDKIRSLEQSY